MKQLLGAFLLMLLAVGACRKETGPRPVAEDFLNAMRERNYEAAGKFGTTETVKLLKQFEKIEQLNGEAATAEQGGKITIVSEDIKGKTATIYFMEAGNPVEQHITLVKVAADGKENWKVALRKEEIRLMQES